MFSIVAIPDANMSRSDNSGTYLVYMLNDPIFVAELLALPARGAQRIEEAAWGGGTRQALVLELHAGFSSFPEICTVPA